MPLRAITVFASQKGGTGKTFLSKQVAAAYADANPNEHVLFIDLTELGDGTKYFFGGPEAMQGKENKLRGVFEMFAAVQKAKKDGQGLWSRLRGSGSKFDMEEYAVQVSSINPSSGLPNNLFLVSSGGETIEAVEEEAGTGSHEDRECICKAIQGALTNSDKTWRVFIDTDGDRRPNSLTCLGYLLADFCVMPIQADQCDFERVGQMLDVLKSLRDEGLARCQVELLLWNRVQFYKAEPSEVGHFRPPKVGIDEIQHLNGKLKELQKSSGDLFARNFETALVRDLPDTVAKSANACGLAFCRMSKGSVKTRGGLTFAVTEDQLRTCQDTIDKILEKLEPDPL